MNWINTVNRIEQIKEMINKNNEYYRSIVGEEYAIDNSGRMVKVVSFDQESLMFNLSLVDDYKTWWDGVEDFLNNVIAKQYLYKINF